jgi:cyclase
VLKARVIPTLLWKQFGLVKGVGFDSWRRVGAMLPAIKVYGQREVDELVLVDIVAHQFNDDPDFESIDEFGRECCVPLTVGGGITRIDQVQRLLRSGADKVSVNTSAYVHPELVSEIAKRHGAQCVVASIDVRTDRAGRDWRCFSHAGRQATGRNVRDWARELEGRGAGEILITSIERDGTLQGYDLALIEAVACSVKIPVIASGGAGNYQHMVDAIKQAGASAVAAASMFHFTEQTPAGAKLALAAAGVPVREPYLGLAILPGATPILHCK